MRRNLPIQIVAVPSEVSSLDFGGVLRQIQTEKPEFFLWSTTNSNWHSFGTKDISVIHLRSRNYMITNKENMWNLRLNQELRSKQFDIFMKFNYSSEITFHPGSDPYIRRENNWVKIFFIFISSKPEEFSIFFSDKYVSMPEEIKLTEPISPSKIKDFEKLNDLYKNHPEIVTRFIHSV